MKDEFKDWSQIMKDNGIAKRNGDPLGSHLIEFYDDGSAMFRLD